MLSESKKILCVSGWGYPASSWAPLEKQLPESIQSVVIDQFSLEAEQPITSGRAEISAYAQNLRRKIVESNPDIVAGWSLGGVVLLEALIHESLPPFKALVLGATPRFVRSSGESVYPGVKNKRLRAMQLQLETEPVTVLENFYQLAAYPAEPRLDPEEIERLVRKFRAALLNGLDYLGRTDLTGKLAQINRSLLVLHGSDDQVVQPAAGRALAKNLKNARFELLAGGHSLPLTRPEILVERLTKLEAEN